MRRGTGSKIGFILFGLILFLTSGSSFYYSNRAYLNTVQIRKEQLKKVSFLDRNELNRIVYRMALTSSRKEVSAFFDEYTKDRLVTEAILSAAIINDTPIMISFALVWKESQFDQHAVGKNAKSADYGLWQLNSLTFYKLSKKQMFDPMTNSKLGAEYLRKKYDEHLRWEKALLAYNCGGISKVPETSINYLCDVLKLEEDISLDFIQRFLA